MGGGHKQKKCTKGVVKMPSYDYIICGGGSAASLMAGTLSKVGAFEPGVSRSVLMLEMGTNNILGHQAFTGYTPSPAVANDPDINTPNYLNPIVNDPYQLNNAYNALITSNNNEYAKVYPGNQNSVDNFPFNFVGSIQDNVLTVTSVTPNPVVSYPVAPTNSVLVPRSLILGPGVFPNTAILRSLIPIPVTYAISDGAAPNSTITYNCANSFTAGDKVVVSNAPSSVANAFNLGTLAVPATVVSANATSFTLLATGVVPTTTIWTFPAVGRSTAAAVLNVTAGLPGNTPIASVSSDSVAITGVISNGATITYTTSVPHTFLPGQSIVTTGIVSGAPSFDATNIATAFNFNGAVIASVTANTFTLNSIVQATYVSGGFAGRLVTYSTTVPHGLLPLQTVSISQVTGATQHNVGGQVVATVPSATTFTLARGVSTAGVAVGGVVSLISGGIGQYKVNVSQNVPAGTVFTSGDRSLEYTSGLGWGGGGNHYFGNAFRSTPEMYNQWAAIANDNNWLYANMLADNLFQKVEDYHAYPGDVTSFERGVAGQTSVLQTSSVAQLNVDPVAIRMSSSFGVPITDDYNISGNNVGVSSLQGFGKLPYYTTPAASNGFPSIVTGSYRTFSFDSYLKLGFIVDQNGNGIDRSVKVTENTVVNRVSFDGNKAVGVEWMDAISKRVFQACANRKVILCAGGIGSPQILQRSGVGPSALLASLSIPMVANSPLVGGRLMNHYGANGNVVGNAANNAVFANPSGRAVLVTDLHGLDPVNGANFVYAADGVRRIFALPRNTAVGPTFGFPQGGATTFTSNVKGSLRIASRDPFSLPLIDWRIFSDDMTGLVQGSDLNKFLTMTKLTRQFTTYAGLNMTAPSPSALVDDATLAMNARLTGSFQSHAVGTCRMADTILNGVVDGTLHVHGTTGLMVADTSIFPVATGGNPMLTVLTVAMKACQILGASI